MSALSSALTELRKAAQNAAKRRGAIAGLPKSSVVRTEEVTS